MKMTRILLTATGLAGGIWGGAAAAAITQQPALQPLDLVNKTDTFGSKVGTSFSDSYAFTLVGNVKELEVWVQSASVNTLNNVVLSIYSGSNLTPSTLLETESYTNGRRDLGNTLVDANLLNAGQYTLLVSGSGANPGVYGGTLSAVPAGGSNVPPVPIPASVLLFGSGLLSLGVLSRVKNMRQV